MERPRAVLTGLGPVTPIGIGQAELLAGLRRGRSATSSLNELPGGFPVEQLDSRITARVDDARLAAHAPLAHPDRRIVFADLALRLALADAGLGEVGGARSALVLGNAVGAPTLVEAIFRRLRNGGLDPAAPPPPLLDHLSFHTPATVLGRRCRGARLLTVSTGCTAGIDAVGLAAELIWSGGADLVIAGSAEAPLTPVVFAAFDRIGALSRRNHEPERASRPFDRQRDGFVLAEGAALLVLEERRHALARGARIYAEVTGFASLSNAYHMTNLPADGAALAECIRRALHDAALAPEEVDHVNAHGSSTPQNDLCETNAVKSALGARAGAVTVNSLKAMIGHALGASNAVEVAACALSLSAGFVFPTANLEEPGEGCDLDYVAGAARETPIQNVVKLSSGFSGIHSALVLGAAGGTG
jgi:3-oxoacyl-(acyl-carrier-protein) synthase